MRFPRLTLDTFAFNASGYVVVIDNEEAT